MGDFGEGINGLIVMLEGVYGKIWANILLTLIGVALAALSLATIMEKLILPLVTGAISIWNFFSKGNTYLPDFVPQFLAFLTGVFSVCFGILLWRYVSNDRVAAQQAIIIADNNARLNRAVEQLKALSPLIQEAKEKRDLETANLATSISQLETSVAAFLEAKKEPGP